MQSDVDETLMAELQRRCDRIIELEVCETSVKCTVPDRCTGSSWTIDDPSEEGHYDTLVEVVQCPYFKHYGRRVSSATDFT